MKELRLLITLCCLLFCGFANAQVTANAGNDTVICAGAPVILGGNPVVTGGTGPYTYVWSHGATTANPTVSPTSTTSYSLTVTDMMGEANVDVITVTVSTPILSPTINQVTCFGANDGSVCLNVVGGTVPFTYNWNPGITFTPCATNLAAGAYNVTVTDAAGCSVTALYTIVEPTAIQLSGTVTNATCFGSSDGSIDVTVTGGTPVYSYTWSTFTTTQNVSNLPVGSYVITVTDVNGCTASDTYTVTEPTALQLSVTTTNASCIYSADGAIDLAVTDGTAPYNYQWSDGSILEDPAGIPTGAFTVTVSDANLCTASISAQVNTVSSLALDSIVATPVTCFAGTDGSICVYVSGGVGANVYSWNLNPPTTSSNCVTGLAAGNYNTTVTDNNGCTVIASTAVTEPAALVVNAYTTDGVNMPDSIISATVTGGTPNYSYAWVNSIADPSFAMISCTDGEIWVTVTDANGCTAVDTVNYVANIDCVWPGDADDNGIADNNDLLAIGLAYGSTGPFRPDNSISWNEKQCEDWVDTLVGGSNYKHIDCDGNGVINANDTFAIIQNYGLTHSKNEEQRDWRSGLPALLVDLVPDTTHAGDTMYANLYLGDAAITATNVYGLAFTLNYDVNVVDTALTQMQFGDSWLGTVADKIHIAKDLKQGQIKCAVTRIDHTNRSGSGQIARAKFVITTDNINGKDLAYYGMQVWVTGLTVISNDGTQLDVNEGQDSTEVEFEPLSVSNIPLADGSLKIQPNPANNMVQINVTREVAGGSIKLMDIQGRSLFETPVTSTVLKIETTTLANGIYLVQLSNGHAKLTRRLIVAH